MNSINILGLPLSSILIIVFVLIASLVTIILFAGVFLSGREKKEKVKKENTGNSSVFASTGTKNKKGKKSIIAEPVKNLSKTEQYNNVFSGAGVPVQETARGGFFTTPPAQETPNFSQPPVVTPVEEVKPVVTPEPRREAPTFSPIVTPKVAPIIQPTTSAPTFLPTNVNPTEPKPMGLPDFSDEDAFLEKQAELRRSQTVSPEPTFNIPVASPAPQLPVEAKDETGEVKLPSTPPTFKITPPPTFN